MYGHIASIAGPTAEPRRDHTQAGRACCDFGFVGPDTDPPTISTQRQTKTASVEVIAIDANQAVYGPFRRFWIMYDPSPSRRPARYAASVGSITSVYGHAVAKPSYWRQQVANMRALDDEMSKPALFEAAT